MNISIAPKLEDKILGVPGENSFAEFKVHSAKRRRSQKQTRRRRIESIGRPSCDRFFVTQCLFAALLLIVPICSGQGSVRFQNIFVLGETPVYGLDPLNPYAEVRSNRRLDLAGRPALEGNDYSAELWVSLMPRAAESELTPVPNTRVFFGEGGIFRGIAKVEIPGADAGTPVTLQVRVWENQGGVIASWEQVLGNAEVPRGTSNLLWDWQLTGMNAQGQVFVGPGAVGQGMQYFGLYIVPEPSIQLPYVALMILLIRHFRRSRSCCVSPTQDRSAP